MKELEKMFESTLEDRNITTSEYKALVSAIADYGITQRKADLLLSKVYKMAENKMNGTENAQVLLWAKKASKAIGEVLHNAPKSESEVYFSPGEDCLNSILRELGSATSCIDICVFTISDNRISDKIEYCHNKGIKIRIITDDDKTFDKGSDVERLSRNGLNVKIDRTRHHMHHKFAIIDNKKVLTGSYNWTRSAEQYNHENILLTNEKNVVSKYMNEFEELWKIMKPYL